MSKLPIWARKPIHKKEVIATPIGWIVKETGEVLKRVIDLDQKLKSLEKDSISENTSLVEETKVETKEDASQESELVVKELTDDKAESKTKKTTRRTKRTKDKEESTSEE